MPIHLRELPKGQRFVLMRTGDKFVYLGVGVSPYSGSYQHQRGIWHVHPGVYPYP